MSLFRHWAKNDEQRYKNMAAEQQATKPEDFCALESSAQFVSALELVTEAADSYKFCWVGRVAFDLLAQVPDMYVDGAVAVDIAFVSPHGLNEATAADRHVGPCGKVVKQPKLGGRKLDDLAFQAHFEMRKVDFKVLEAVDLGIRLGSQFAVGTAQEGPNPGHQFAQTVMA